jgi:hypothetical protein
MTKINKWKKDLSNKSDEELFNIYCGSPKHLPKDIRYYAARILETRDFQFDNISAHKKQWELERMQQNSSSLSSIFTNFAAFLNNKAEGIREEKSLIELSH